ncbi:MAG: MCP four helix bundle domain-containing protein [Bdellovibrio sp.]|nr:MCP four helix bundle domain-containing protein [Bdellovibrio sp.]
MKSWFRGLRGKLLFSAFLPVVAFTLITGVAIHSTNKLGAMLNDAYTDIIPNMDSLSQVAMQRARVGYFIWASLGTSNLPKAREGFIKKTEEAWSDFKEAQKYYESTPFNEDEEKNYAKVRQNKDKLYALTDSMIALLKKGTPEADEEVLKAMNNGAWHVLAIEVQKASEANFKVYSQQASAGNEQQNKDRKALTELLILISGSCIFALFGILMWIAYRVSNSVGNIAGQLQDAGTQVAAAISQLTSAGQTLSEASTESAASLEETVASLEEMSSMVKMNSDNAKQAAALSISSKDAAEEGQKEIASLIGSMQEISKSSKKIEEIISVIDDIAFQTNLLALNAAVEAARAGEQGKGFAVVADAVRTLAQRSAVAAKDITGLIKESVEKVDQGSAIADRSGEVLNNIVNSVKKVSDLNNEISAASSEQTTGIQQISKAMNQLDEGTQANAASSEEIAASSEEISAQADQMKRLVENLNVVILGSDSAPQAERHFEKASAPKSNVVEFKPQSTAKSAPQSAKAVGKKPHGGAASSASEMIPFDDDGPRGKVGTTDGF